ncbi:helix-turn-helix domain-containing protein, partial [Clostridium sp. VAP23]|uniref:helix-turn-helix domain-containing protein n=1 Tax=Clostridium sp. VAP23 TaxID=2949981 RepID=UPI00207A21DB
MNDDVEQIKKLAESGLCGAFKKTYFVQAENNFIRNSKYTVNQKMVYLCLQSYAGAVTSCFPSKSTVAKDLNLSEKTVYTILKQLEQLGAIIVINQIKENNRKTSNMYILSDINKDTGEFIPDSIKQFKCLTLEPIRVKG